MINPKIKNKKKFVRQQQQGPKRYRSRSPPRYNQERSRKRSRSPPRHSRGRSKSVHPRKKARFASTNKQPASASSEKPKSGVFSSPSSFDDAWCGHFFDKETKDALTSLGFNANDIPDILAHPLGGRLKFCVGNWKLIGA